MGKSIVDIQNMGDALRNTGYKNIESAVSEIVDNSIEAGAKDVFIILKENVNKLSGRQQVSEIAFLDDGMGMNEVVLAECLGIGATTRQERKGMGRFGVGLPQASLYACPEVVVYSWQEGICNCKKVYLDIDKVKSGDQTEIEDPVIEEIPKEYIPYIMYRTLENKYDFSKSGTLVVWRRCDRIQPKTRGPLVERLEFALGQKFRYFISKEICRLKIICDNNQEMATDVYPNDPLFLMENNYVLGNPERPGEIYKKKCGSDLETFFEPYTANGIGDGNVSVSIKYYNRKGEISESKVLVRFSIVKDKFYDKTAFKDGADPGNYKFGKYAKKMEGISIIRANREIDFRKFDFYDNVNMPQHRWWGCEIIFEPELDEAFGVANNKQYVELKEIDEKDIDLDEEVQPIWLQLVEVLRNTISAMYNKNKETRRKSRTPREDQTAATDIINAVEKDNDGYENKDNDTKDNISEEEIIETGKKALTDNGYENPTNEEATRFIGNSINFVYKDCGKRCPAFDFRFVLTTIVIIINTGHEFYGSFLNKIYGSPEAKTTFELFLGSFIQAIKNTNTYQPSQNDRLVSAWYKKLDEYIFEQLNPRDAE